MAQSKASNVPATLSRLRAAAINHGDALGGSAAGINEPSAASASKAPSVQTIAAPDGKSHR